MHATEPSWWGSLLVNQFACVACFLLPVAVRVLLTHSTDLTHLVERIASWTLNTQQHNYMWPSLAVEGLGHGFVHRDFVNKRRVLVALPLIGLVGRLKGGFGRWRAAQVGDEGHGGSEGFAHVSHRCHHDGLLGVLGSSSPLLVHTRKVGTQAFLLT